MTTRGPSGAAFDTRAGSQDRGSSAVESPAVTAMTSSAISMTTTSSAALPAKTRERGTATTSAPAAPAASMTRLTRGRDHQDGTTTVSRTGGGCSTDPMTLRHRPDVSTGRSSSSTTGSSMPASAAAVIPASASAGEGAILRTAAGPISTTAAARAGTSRPEHVASRPW